jgi:hypothetical protein
MKRFYGLFCIAAAAFVIQCSYPGMENGRGSDRVLYGKASYYGDEFHGRKTASGEIYDRNRMTAAHRTLAFGTVCRVTNLKNGKTAVVRVNDRGPFIETHLRLVLPGRPGAGGRPERSHGCQDRDPESPA